MGRRRGESVREGERRKCTCPESDLDRAVLVAAVRVDTARNERPNHAVRAVGTQHRRQRSLIMDARDGAFLRQQRN